MASKNRPLSDLFTETGATFSACRRYRYRLWRYWDRTKPALCFLMLNPSTADDLSNDPTVERCQRRAIAMGFGGLEVVNLFAYRSTDRSVLPGLVDHVGPENDDAIRAACSMAGMVICAWGEDGRIKGRSAQVCALLPSIGVVPYALALNKSGEPIHPLYVSYDVAPMPFLPR